MCSFGRIRRNNNKFEIKCCHRQQLFGISRSYMAGPKFLSEERIDGKNIIVTGASSGIGRETAVELAKRGGRIILAVKNIEAGENVAKRIRKIPGGVAEVKKLDLSSLQGVSNFAKSLGRYLNNRHAMLFIRSFISFMA
jgi:NADPH:quinone reductase-like Zn-dependent oxidoreductase